MGYVAENPGKVGQKVKLMRQSKEMTQEALADVVKIDRSSLANIERGMHRPSLEVMTRLAEALDVTVDYLLSDRTEKTKVDIVNEPFAQFVLQASQELTSEDKERIKAIIQAWRKKKKE